MLRRQVTQPAAHRIGEGTEHLVHRQRAAHRHAAGEHDEPVRFAFHDPAGQLGGQCGLADPANTVQHEPGDARADQFHRPAALLASTTHELAHLAGQQPRRQPGADRRRSTLGGRRGRIERGRDPGTGQHGQHRPLTQGTQALLAFVRRVLQLLLHAATGVGDRAEHVQRLVVGQRTVGPVNTRVA